MPLRHISANLESVWQPLWIFKIKQCEFTLCCFQCTACLLHLVGFLFHRHVTQVIFTVLMGCVCCEDEAISTREVTGMPGVSQLGAGPDHGHLLGVLPSPPTQDTCAVLRTMRAAVPRAEQDATAPAFSLSQE